MASSYQAYKAYRNIWRKSMRGIEMALRGA